METVVWCEYCDKLLSKEKGEEDYGCLTCHGEAWQIKIDKLKRKNRELVKALLFYANKDNYDASPKTVRYNKIANSDLEVRFKNVQIGGLRARKTLIPMGEYVENGNI